METITFLYKDKVTKFGTLEMKDGRHNLDLHNTRYAYINIVPTEKEKFVIKLRTAPEHKQVTNMYYFALLSDNVYYLVDIDGNIDRE